MNKNDESERNGFVWPVILKNPNAHANIDFYYGPYDSLDSLKEGVPNDLWVPGFTAAVQDEDGVVTEWWVQGEGASARWEQKGVRHDTYVALKGVLKNMDELEAIEKPEVGDMYLVPEEGETGSFLEYVNTGDKWELLGRNSGKTKGVLTMIESDGVKEFNGYTDMSVDLSKYAKKDELFKQDLSVMYMNLKSGDSYYYDADGVMQYSGLTMYRYIKNGAFGDGSKKVLHIGLGSNYNKISITRYGIYFNLDYGAIWKLNPLVLVVRITPNDDGTYTTKALYDPYASSRYQYSTTYDTVELRYTTKHNLVSSGAVKEAYRYSMMGSVSRTDLPVPAYVSVMLPSPDTVTFIVGSSMAGYRFDYCDLFFYDFSFFW